MLLYEHEGKTLFREYGIPTPEFAVADRHADLEAALSAIRPPVMIKAQVLAGGRGKAGGIVAAGSVAAARDAAARLLGSTVKGHTVESVLIEPQVAIERELYLAATFDAEDVLLLVGGHGGIDVESYFTDPSSVQAVRIDPLYGPSEYQVRNALDRLGVAPALWSGLARIALDLFRLFRACDAKLAEINPLAVASDGGPVALDARVEVDDGALFRQPRLAEIQRARGHGDGFETRLKELQVQYVPMGGSVGLVSQGAGAGVAIMDWVELEGGRVAAFVDMDYAILSGQIEEALRFVLGHLVATPSVRSLLVNFTTCGVRVDFIAEALAKVLSELRGRRRQPVFIHLGGNREAAAHALMQKAGHELCETLGEAVRGACRAAQMETV